MKQQRPLRSVLYMPGSNARALEKAKDLAADSFVFDLEDSVAPDMKGEARTRILEALKSGLYGGRTLAVRVNHLSSAWGEDDLAALATSGAQALLVPKVVSPDDIFEVGRRLSRAGAPADLEIWAMMETPQAILRAEAIAAASADDAGRRLACLILGTNDLAKETRARQVPGRLPMLAWLSACVLAARAYELSILDTVYADFRDLDGFAAECAAARDMGFDGKTLIHPGQIAAANTAFGPDAEEVAEARAIIDAFERPENRDKGAIALNGKMVERLHAEMARRTVAMAEAIEGLARDAA